MRLFKIKQKRYIILIESMLLVLEARNMDQVILGQRIREARKNKELTQEQLAEIAGIGLMYLGEIERGQKMPSLKILCKIIEALDISADYLLRDVVQTGKEYVLDDITAKLVDLTPLQRKTASDILDAYIKNIKFEK